MIRFKIGSSSYISNREGNVSQHMEYLPFGELLVDEHFNSYNTPFKFNGKELDEETGNYYYGARYYNPKTSIWLSVDPLAEKMPQWSSYAYAFNNPIMFNDPTGLEPEGIDPPTNSVQINSQIQAIRDQYPDAPIYLMVQSGTDEAQARERAGSPSTLSYDRYTIQEGSDYSNGSFIVSLRHGENKITGSIISTSNVNEVERSFALTFQGAEGVGGADQLTSSSASNLPVIAGIINDLNQNISVTSGIIIKTDKPINPSTVTGRGLLNGKVGSVNGLEFGEARISTVLNGLIASGANPNLLDRGLPNVFNQTDPNRRSGTFIDFSFSSPVLRNSVKQSSSGTIQLNKGKFQIY